MRIYAGIDEAGYGPLLGPMTVACTAWSTDEALGLWPDLWKPLSSAVCKRPTDHKGRVAIDDSKTLNFQPNVGIGLTIKNFHLDYAFTDIGDASVALYSHVISLRLKLDKPKNMQ